MPVKNAEGIAEDLSKYMVRNFMDQIKRRRGYHGCQQGKQIFYDQNGISGDRKIRLPGYSNNRALFEKIPSGNGGFY
jgi:hypothetical protein